MDTISRIEEEVGGDPVFFLRTIPDHNDKSALVIDIETEESFRLFVDTDLEGVRLLGEECPERKITNFNLFDEERVCVLVDMVDGTDLLERGLHNWCSSAVFFHPKSKPGKRILAAFIGVPGGSFGSDPRGEPLDNSDFYRAAFTSVYFGVRGSRPEVFEADASTRGISGPSEVTKVEDASVCFYGQKASRLRYTSGQDLFGGQKVETEFDGAADAVNGEPSDTKKGAKKKERMRVYNLAGMPMIAKLIDKRVKEASGIDAVFELEGQSPHDVVPGAFLAMEAKCAVIDLDTGKPMTREKLELSLLEPFADHSKLRYIIASTYELAEEIRKRVKVRLAVSESGSKLEGDGGILPASTTREPRT
jgi:fructose-1,6-bisphosphatase/inositol monophosphatase family enzyme